MTGRNQHVTLYEKASANIAQGQSGAAAGECETQVSAPVLAVHVAGGAHAAVGVADLVARRRLVVLVERRAQLAQHLHQQGRFSAYF